MTDIGTGTYTILTQIAAEAMEMPVERVTVLMGDTNYPPTDGSGGSFGAATSGAAVLAACRKLKAGLASGMTEAEGSVTPAELSTSYSHAGFGAHFVEAAVHRDTGEVRVRRMLGVFAAGRILNSKTARSQMIGGMIWGIGSALMEENIVDQRYGSFVNQDLASYHVAVNADVGELDVVFLDEDDPHGSPLGSKGIGELGICGAGAAVINAIHNATGARHPRLPRHTGQAAGCARDARRLAAEHWAEGQSIRIDAMIVCSCNTLSDHDVRRVMTGACTQTLTAGKVYDCLGCRARCGRCVRTIQRIVQEALPPREANCLLSPDCELTPGADAASSERRALSIRAGPTAKAMFARPSIRRKRQVMTIQGREISSGTVISAAM